MSNIGFIGVVNIERREKIYVYQEDKASYKKGDISKSAAGHMHVKFVNLSTGEVQNFGFESSYIEAFGDGQVVHHDSEAYIGKPDLISPFALDYENGNNAIKYWENLEEFPNDYNLFIDSCIDKVIESFRAANVKIGTGDGELVPSWNIPFVDAANKKDWQEKSQNLTKEEKEKIEIFMDIIKHDTLKDDDFKHLAKLPLKELQIFHEEFLLIEQERERILEKHKELGAIGISNVLKMNLEQLKQFEKATEQFALYDPIALDLDGNGKIDTLSLENGVFFDHNGDKVAFKSSWVNSSDGILARDINGDGKITSGAELFGNFTKLKNGELAKNGAQALKDLDDNNDGIFDSNDKAFNEILVWQDKNSDGISQKNELKTLSEHNIKSIDLEFSTDNTALDKDNKQILIGSFSTNISNESKNNLASDIDFSVDTVEREMAESAGLVKETGFVRDFKPGLSKDIGEFYAKYKGLDNPKISA